MLSLTSAASALSSTSTSSFKVNHRHQWLSWKIWLSVTSLFSFFQSFILSFSCLHLFVPPPLRRGTGCVRNLQKWKLSETSCADKWTPCRSTLIPVPMPFPKMNFRGTEVYQLLTLHSIRFTSKIDVHLFWVASVCKTVISGAVWGSWLCCLLAQQSRTLTEIFFLSVSCSMRVGNAHWERIQKSIT